MFSLDSDLSEAQHRLRELQREATILTEERLPALLNELAFLQATPVVRGDYELKVARQNYFTSKQDQVRAYSKNSSMVSFMSYIGDRFSVATKSSSRISVHGVGI